MYALNKSVGIGMENDSLSDLLIETIKNLKFIVFDFDGVFTDNRVMVLQDGTEGVLCSRADGFGLDAAKKMGVELMVLSKEQNPVVGARCKKLNLRCIQGCDNKAEVLREEVKRLGLTLDRVSYMGNDINDIECLEVVGLPVCVADSYPEVIAVSKLITGKNGGCGAVREFCDFVASIMMGKTRSVKKAPEFIEG